MRVEQSVLYSPPRGARYSGSELAATVASINENGSVNLMIVAPDGNVIQNPPTHIPFKEGGCLPEGGCCWVVKEIPPFFDVPYVKPPHTTQTHTMELANGGKIAGYPVPELPPGAVLMEQRPATPEEVAAACDKAKGSFTAPLFKKKPLKKTLRKTP